LNRKPRKRIPTKINTPGDYILAKRYEKGLHPHEIGKKMGISGSLVLAWERGEGQPDEAQWNMLGRLLAFDAWADLLKPHK
jgi:transcriptional regulator with XRE-family HTH domain